MAENKEHSEDHKYRPISFHENLPSKLLLRAKMELNETDENMALGLKILKDKIKREKMHLEKDEVLLKFLRLKKYRFEESFQSYKNYLHAFNTCITKWKIPDLDSLYSMVNKKICCVLPYRDAEDRVILVYRLGTYKLQGLSIEDAVLLLVGMGFCISKDPASQIGGVAFIVDAKEMIFSDAPTIISYSRWLIPMLKGFPGRLRRIDIINQPSIFGKIVNLIRPFLPAKMRDRIVFHGHNKDSLLKIYPESIMPFEYGGSQGPLDNGHLRSIVRTFYTEIKSTYDILANGK